jgi:hypothetical protein
MHLSALLALIINLWLGRVPIRLYVRSVEDIQDLEDALPLSNWETVSYINRPFEIQKAEGMCYTVFNNIVSQQFCFSICSSL